MAGVLGEATEGGGRAETDEADDEHAPPAEIVGYPPAEEKQAAKSKRVGAQHPLAVGGRNVQGSLGQGRATTTTEASSTIISWETAITASDHHRLGSGSGLVRVVAVTLSTAVGSLVIGSPSSGGSGRLAPIYSERWLRFNPHYTERSFRLSRVRRPWPCDDRPGQGTAHARGRRAQSRAHP